MLAHSEDKSQNVDLLYEILSLNSNVIKRIRYHHLQISTDNIQNICKWHTKNKEIVIYTKPSRFQDRKRLITFDGQHIGWCYTY